MDTVTLVIIGVVIYAAGLGLFMRFAAFVHRCDDEMQSMLDLHAEHRRGLRAKAGRSSRPKPRLKAA